MRLFKEREREHMALVFVTFCQNKRSQTMNEFYISHQNTSKHPICWRVEQSRIKALTLWCADLSAERVVKVAVIIEERCYLLLCFLFLLLLVGGVNRI